MCLINLREKEWLKIRKLHIRKKLITELKRLH